jgi:hypothetical protein
LSLYAQEYGLDRPSQSAKWLELLLASWRLVYAEDGTYLFQATPPPVFQPTPSQAAGADTQ